MFDLYDTCSNINTFDEVMKYTSFTQVLQNVLEDEELAVYESFYHEIVQGKLAKKAAGHRHDLGSHVAQKKPEVENITQVIT